MEAAALEDAAALAESNRILILAATSLEHHDAATLAKRKMIAVVDNSAIVHNSEIVQQFRIVQ